MLKLRAGQQEFNSWKGQQFLSSSLSSDPLRDPLGSARYSSGS